MTVSRRSFNTLLGAGAAGLLVSGSPASAAIRRNPFFPQGVASGDPLQDSVILWTRIDTPYGGTGAVRWRVALDPGMRIVVQRGVTFAMPSRDNTVKLDVTGLLPGVTYYYQFHHRGMDSPIGRTRTLPLGTVDRLRFAVASCSNLPFGYFNSYRAIAERADLDFFIHLGDYIYEYGNAEFGDGSAIGRIPAPNKEIVTLEDYRTRYAQYRNDPDLQELHRQHAAIIVWDDHEIANDSWTDGAENHDASEGSYALRKAAAEQAWREWMPVRETFADLHGQIYRSFQIGDLADLIMLDTRHIGRSQQVAGSDFAGLTNESRTLLGAEQEAWFYAQLAESAAAGRPWRIVGQQVMVGQLFGTDGTPFNPDQWDGYIASRNRFLGTVLQQQINNVVVLTGDLHSSWGNELTFNPFDPSTYNPVTGAGSVAVEFVGPGITSPAIEDAATAAGLRQQVLATHPHVKLVDLFQRGYMLIDITPQRAQAEWYHPVTLTSPDPAHNYGGALVSAAGTRTLRPAEGPLQPKSGVRELAP